MIRKSYFIHSLVDQKRLYVEITGLLTHPDMTFVFNHGMGGDSNALIPLVQELIDLFPNSQCITYDLRGHGLSTRKYPLDVESLEYLYAQDLVSICRELKITKPIFIGHSFGGIICQEYINQQFIPQPSKVILASTLLKTPISILPRVWWRRLLSLHSKLVSDKKHYKRTYEQHLQFKNSFDYSLYRVISDMRSINIVQFFLLYMAIFGWKNETPDKVNRPNILYVYGENDLVVLPYMQKRYLSKIPKAKTQMLHCNHNSVTNVPEALAQTIATFISQPN